VASNRGGGCSMIACLAAALVTAGSPTAQAQDGANTAPVALVETFADGQSVFEIATPKSSWRWTPQFPRVAGFKPRDGEPAVMDLKITRVLVGRDIQVGVSVLVGPSREERPIAEVLITPGSRV